jgi:DNA-directed RNA polymerase I, II, and III subunit RPABC2
MDEKDEYSDVESDVESDTENVLELSTKSKFNPNKNIKPIESDDEDESVASEIEQDEDDENDYNDENDEENENDEESNVLNSLDKNPFNIGADDDDDDGDDDDDDDENYLQKFNENIKKNIITDYHPELKFHNYEEIENLTTIIKNENGTIVDPLHKTLPFLTKYEKTRILGERTHQINSGSKPFVQIESDVIDGYLIALAELEEKKIPFIVKRPLPNGGCEYWKLKDLEII